MTSYCSNILDIIGDKNKIIDFLYKFYCEDNIFKMNNIISNQKADVLNFANYNRSIWGTEEDIHYSCDIKTALCSYKEMNKNYGKFTITYLTKNSPNITFIKNVSHKNKDLILNLRYFNNDCIYCGEILYKDKKEVYQIYKESKDNDNSIIDVIKLAINKEIITPDSLENILNNHSNKVKNYFISYLENEENDIIIDFNNLKRKTINKNILNNN